MATHPVHLLPVRLLLSSTSTCATASPRATTGAASRLECSCSSCTSAPDGFFSVLVCGGGRGRESTGASKEGRRSERQTLARTENVFSFFFPTPAVFTTADSSSSCRRGQRGRREALAPSGRGQFTKKTLTLSSDESCLRFRMFFRLATGPPATNAATGGLASDGAGAGAGSDIQACKNRAVPFTPCPSPRRPAAASCSRARRAMQQRSHGMGRRCRLETLGPLPRKKCCNTCWVSWGRGPHPPLAPPCRHAPCNACGVAFCRVWRGCPRVLHAARRRGAARVDV